MPEQYEEEDLARVVLLVDEDLWAVLGQRLGSMFVGALHAESHQKVHRKQLDNLKQVKQLEWVRLPGNTYFRGDTAEGNMHVFAGVSPSPPPTRISEDKTANGICKVP
jgi:hypothetical protein